MDNPSTPKRDYTLHQAAAILRVDESEVSGMVRRSQLTGYMDEDGVLHVLLPVPDAGRGRRPSGGNGSTAQTWDTVAGATAAEPPGRAADPLVDSPVWDCLRETFRMQRELLGELVQTFPNAPRNPAQPSGSQASGAPAGDTDLAPRLARLEELVERQQEDLRLLTESVRIVRDYLDRK